MKKPKHIVTHKTQGQRLVRILQFDALKDNINWKFSMMDLCEPFAVSDITIEEWKKVLEKMREWENMTWGEILGRRDHAIEINKLSSEAKKRLIELNLDDFDEVLSLHIDGKKRLFGLRYNNTFYVLWWDREHKVCPSLKKHT